MEKQVKPNKVQIIFNFLNPNNFYLSEWLSFETKFDDFVFHKMKLQKSYKILL